MPDPLLEKALPHNSEAERAILGAILLNPNLYDEAVTMVRADSFYRESHRKIFAAMAGVVSAGRTIDLVTLQEDLYRSGDIERIGGSAYLCSLTDGIPMPSSISDYAGIITEKSRLRSIVHISSQAVAKALSDDPSSEILESLERDIFSMSKLDRQQGPVAIGQLLGPAFQAMEHGKPGRLAGLNTGFLDLNNLTGGFQAGELIIIAARPSLGKTSLALNIAQTVSAASNAIFFSLEMPAQQLVLRLLAAEARVGLHKIRAGYISRDDWVRLAKAADTLSACKLWIDDSSTLTPFDLRARARRTQSEHGLGLLVVDYLQLMDPGGQVRGNNRQQDISLISRMLKRLAKELSIPVIALSQLNRLVEQRGADHRPRLSDLRESGSIEQDADVVLFIYEEKGDKSDAIELIVAKQRNGPTGTVTVAFQKDCTRFMNYAFQGST